MDRLDGYFKLFINGAPLGVIDGKLFALLSEQDQRQAEVWQIVPDERTGRNAVIIRASDGLSGWVVPKPGERRQIEIAPLISTKSLPPVFPANQVFFAKPLVMDTLGAFAVRSAADDQLVGRRFIENRSLLPKEVVSDTDDEHAFVVAVPVDEAE
ncbi:I66 family serine proteinase inhibitor [Kitasatospora sp. NPDC093806]|uniref:I66 family serine proteinase inhibitor n=1 Tax=Kitasatospora sp. NPDC093806 TaxID=3155075 RepID=UPI003417E6E3